LGQQFILRVKEHPWRAIGRTLLVP